MNKLNKRKVWLLTSILLIVLGLFTPLFQLVNYYNLSIENQNKIQFQIEFEKDLDVIGEQVSMSITNIGVGNVIFSEDSLSNSNPENKALNFDFISDSIPTYFSLGFTGVSNKVLRIKRMNMLFNGKKIVLPVKNFLKNPAVEIDDLSTVLYVNDAQDFGYSPYKYIMPVLYLHKIKWSEILLWISIAILTSYLITGLIFTCWNSEVRRKINRDAVLIYLVSVSLLFDEHWSSKVLIMIGLFLVYDVWTKNKKMSKLQFGSFIMLFGYSGMSLIWSDDVSNSLILLGRLFPLVLLPIWLSTKLEHFGFRKVFRYISLTYILFGLATIFLATLRYYTSSNFGEFFYHTLLEPFGGANAIYIALLYSMVMLVNVSVLQFEKAEISYFLIVILLLVYVIMLSSKMISFMVTISMMVIIFGKFRHLVTSNERKFGFLGLAVIIFILILSSSKMLQSRYIDVLNLNDVKEVLYRDQFGPVYPWNGLSLRVFQLRCFGEIETNPDFNSFLGVGLNNGQPLLDERYDFYELYKGRNPEKRGGYYVYNFHNQYAQTLIETGIGGFLFLIFVLFQLVTFAIREKNYLMFTIFLMLLSILFSESLLLRSKGIIIFVFFPMVVYQIDLMSDRKK